MSWEECLETHFSKGFKPPSTVPNLNFQILILNRVHIGVKYSLHREFFCLFFFRKKVQIYTLYNYFCRKTCKYLMIEYWKFLNPIRPGGVFSSPFFGTLSRKSLTKNFFFLSLLIFGIKSFFPYWYCFKSDNNFFC